jgi:putative signal transducing protein
MTQSLVVVYTAAGQLEANIVKGMLEAAGIPAELSQESAGTAYGLTVGTMGLVDVLVTAEQAEQATALIEAMRQGELEEEIPNDEQAGTEATDET